MQFGENQEFYVQWRQRFSPEFLNTFYQGGGGWKPAIITTGDQVGRLYASCEALGVIVQNTYQRGFAQMYHSCTGSTSHGPYDGFDESFQGPNGPDFKLPKRPPCPICLYSQGHTNPPSFFPPTGNCFKYIPNEWITFQVRIKPGPRVKDEFVDSHVDMWIAREGQPGMQVFNWGPYNLSAGASSENQRYGKIFLLPYNTGKEIPRNPTPPPTPGMTN